MGIGEGCREAIVSDVGGRDDGVVYWIIIGTVGCFEVIFMFCFVCVKRRCGRRALGFRYCSEI